MSLPKQPNQSLIDGLACLQELASCGRPVGGRELARRLEMEPTRAHRLIKTLAYLGLADQLPDKRFVSGKGMHVLSAQSLYGSGLIRAVGAVLEDYDAGNLSIAFGVLWKDRVSYLLFRRPGMTVAESIGASGSFPADQSAIGRVLMTSPAQPYSFIERGAVNNASLAVPVGTPALGGLAFAGHLPQSKLDTNIQTLKILSNKIADRHQAWLTRDTSI